MRKILDTTLKWARAAGIELSIDDDDLVLEASAPPPAAVLDALSLHKADVVRMLRPSEDGWSAQDWQVAFDKRAGLAQFNDALSRAEAEAQAFACCVVEWLDRNPEQSPPGRCHGCGCRDHTHDPLLPFGVESTGHAWLHSRCWPAWYASRKVEAVAALTAMRIAAPCRLPSEILTSADEDN